MKKQYMKPETIRVEVALQQMIAESGSAPINRDQTIANEADIEARRSFNVWGDDEEEDI